MKLTLVGVPVLLIGVLFLLAVMPFLRPAQIGTISLAGQVASAPSPRLPRDVNLEVEAVGMQYFLVSSVIDETYCNFDLRNEAKMSLLGGPMKFPCTADGLRKFIAVITNPNSAASTSRPWLREKLLQAAERWIEQFIMGGGTR